MALFKSNKTNSFLGVDIGAGSIKVVELGVSKNRPTLLTYGYSERPLGEARVSPFDNPKETGALLAQICKKAGVKSTQAMTALPLSSVFSAILAVPRTKDQKLMKQQIDAQITKLTPLPISEMITYSTFFDEMGQTTQKQTNKKETRTKDQKEVKKGYARVLVTGSAKTLVQKYIEIFRAAKLELQAIDTESFALIRSLIGRDKSTIMILDMGFQRTNLTVVQKGIPFLTRSINIGGYSITKQIMEQMNFKEAEAEQIKVDLGLTAEQAQSSGVMPKILEPFMQSVLNEIKYAFQLFANMEFTESKQVEKLIITGGSSMLPKITDFFAEKLDLNVYRGDPWARVVYPTDLRPLLDEVGPRMSVSIGLGMREMDK
ncbi:type IV pilus assembly protein PilM [Patescibacteria group bacterium]